MCRSCKTVQKLRELNKGKLIYWILNECVDYFHNSNFLNLALYHTGAYKPIQDQNDPYWTTRGYLGPYQTMAFPIEHYGPCWTIRDKLGHTGPCGTIPNQTGPYGT